MKKAIVFGGNGFIGQHLVKELSKDHVVIVADINNSTDTTENISYIYCDFTKQKDFASLIENVDLVFHLVCSTIPEDGTDNFEQEIKDNLFSTIRLLDSKQFSSEKRIFFVSSGGAIYGNSLKQMQSEDDKTLPVCKYALIKDYTEKLLELYRIMHGIQYSVIRMSNPYGTKVRKGQRQGLIPILADCIWNNKDFNIWGNGENVRDYIHINDAVKAIRSIMEYNGTERLFNVGSGRGYSINDVICLMKDSFKCSYDKIVYKAARLCDVDHNILDISNLYMLTGWKPEIQLSEGIQILVQQYKEHEQQ